MWLHFVNLLSRSWFALVAAMGTTTLAIVVGIVAFLFILSINLVSKLRKDGWSWRVTMAHFSQNLRDSILPTVAGTILVWAALFGSFVALTVYRDHQSLVAKIVALKNAPKPICPTCAAACPAPKACKVSIASDTSKADKKRLREALGKFVQRGMTIRDHCADPGVKKVQLEAAGQAWANDVVAYLRANFDASYVDQFWLTHTELTPADIPAEMLPFWHGMNERIQTLDRFIDQLK